jgi:DNA helicase II / ATP-dependent DNA helicase PcrA
MRTSAVRNGFERFIDLLCNYFLGKGGDTPAKGDLAEATNIRKAFDEWYARRASGRDIRKNSLLVAILAVYAETRALTMTGDPDADWRACDTFWKTAHAQG